MSSKSFTFSGGSQLPAIGERYIPGTLGAIQLEHFHRYLFAIRFAGNRDVVDVASGEGYGAALLDQVAASVIGVDVAAEIVEYSNRRYASRSLSFRVGNATSLPCESSSADVVVSFETIEHLEDHDGFFSEIKRVLRPKGVLVMSTPDRPVYDATLSQKNEFHLRELDRSEFEALLTRNFQKVEIFEQRSLHGSAIVAARKAHGSLEFFESSDGVTFSCAQDTIEAPFLVAVASDTEIVCPSTSVMHSPAELDKLRGDLGYASGEMWRLQTRIPEVEAECSDLRHEIEVLRNKLADAEARASEGRSAVNELKDAKVIAELARAETRYLRNKLARFKQVG